GTGPVIAGITSAVTQPCVPPGFAEDADVFRYRAWIESAAAGDLSNTACDDLVPIAGTAFSGALSVIHAVDLYSFQVPEGAKSFRVGLNGECGVYSQRFRPLRQGRGPTNNADS